MNVLDVISESMEDGKKVERLPSGGTKTTYNNGTIVYKDAEGNVHREDDLPAVHYETAVPSDEWFTHGVHTRIGKPATVYDNGNTTWYVNDQKHRIDGPAVDWKTKTFWFINGIELTNAVDPFMKKYGITYPYKKDEAAVAKLNANKKDVISFLLRLIKNTESQSEVALPFIYMLKATGVTWPELDAIQRSGEGSLQLNESAVDFDHQINKFVNELRKFRSYALMDLMDSAHHWQNGGATDADLLKIINTPEVTAAIKLWLSRVLAKPSDADMDILIHTLNLLTKIGVRWHKGDDNPFKDHKAEVIRSLLNRVKECDHYTRQFIIQELESLQLLGIDWPELDIISKSLHSEKYPMRENDDEDDYGLRDDALGMVKDRVVQGIEFMRKYGLTLNDVPKARAVIEKKKNTVIKHMLTKIKSAVNVHEIQRGYIFDYVTQLINDLKDWGIDWPEFNVIQKSLLGFHRELSMNENEVPWNARKYAVPDFEKAIIDKDSIGIMTRTLDALIRLEGIKYATEVMNLNKQNILDYLQHNLEDELGSRHGTSRDTVAPIKGFILLTRWPELTKMLTDNKERIIKKMLQEIIDNGMSDVIVTLDVLAKLGIDWPELAIIDKSLNAKKSDSAIAEALNLNPEKYASTFEAVDTLIDRNQIYHALEFLKKKLKFTDIPVPIVYQILDEHKHAIMKNILTMISKEETPFASALVQFLEDMSCKWPELAALRKSIEAFTVDRNERYDREQQEYQAGLQREREAMQRHYSQLDESYAGERDIENGLDPDADN